MNLRNNLLLIIILYLTITSCSGVFADRVLFSTDFTDIQGWETNSNNSFFLDSSGRYHYLIEGGTGSYASYPLSEPHTGPFTLEFDVYPVSTDEKSSFRFGLGTDSLDSQKGPLIIAELNNQNGDNAFSLVAISKENLRSKTFSIMGKENYSGNTVRFADGEEYHIRLTWYPVDKRVSITVTKPGDNVPLFSHFVKVSGKIEELTHLFITSTGEGQNGMKAEGFIDNISLTALSSIPATTEPTITQTLMTPTPTLLVKTIDTPEEYEIPLADIPDRTPLPTPPVPTPTQESGFLPWIGISGICIALLFMRKR
ncbi:MAG: hypothetical protein GXY48_05030 [Methanomicrobiales archaeon]|nr:hypothetical protein [Methanomicrobiales archaeon]